jgi:hypothetical protein
MLASKYSHADHLNTLCLVGDARELICVREQLKISRRLVAASATNVRTLEAGASEANAQAVLPLNL